VARWTTNHVLELTRSIREAIQHRGFAFIEVMCQCPTQQRRLLGFRDPVHKLPTRILEMFSESTYTRGREPDGYGYIVPVSSPEETLVEAKDTLERLAVGTAPVDHLTLGRVVRLESQDQGIWDELSRLSSVDRVAGPLEGKVELGVFLKEDRPEFTQTLRGLHGSTGG
jgi:hypothetical protein